MKKKIGSNMYIEEKDGISILYSYETPVAQIGNGVFRTERNWSATTNRHINKWLAGYDTPQLLPQSYFDQLVRSW